MADKPEGFKQSLDDELFALLEGLETLYALYLSKVDTVLSLNLLPLPVANKSHQLPFIDEFLVQLLHPIA